MKLYNTEEPVLVSCPQPHSFFSKRSADLSCRSAAFSFESSPSHRLARQLTGMWSIVRQHRLSCSAASTPAYSGKLDHFHCSGRFTRPRRTGCSTGVPPVTRPRRPCYHKQAWRGPILDVAVIKERTPQPGHAINLPAVRCRGNNGPSRRALAGVKSRGPTNQVRATLATNFPGNACRGGRRPPLSLPSPSRKRR